jgi:hypothetical protein
LHRLGLSAAGVARWYGFPEQNAVAVRIGTACRGLDLDSGAVYAEPERFERISSRAQSAYLLALEHETPPPCLKIVPASFPTNPLARSDRFLSHFKATGSMYFRHNAQATVCPIRDGEHLLRGVDVIAAQAAGNTLAIRCEQSTIGRKWFLLDIADRANIKEIPGSIDDESVSRLSLDGLYFAQLRKDNEVAVHAFPESGKPVITTGAQMRTWKSRFHNNLRVLLGQTGMQIIIGRLRHTLSWKEGPLSHTFDRMDKDQPSQPNFEEARRDLSHRLVQLDAVRFPAAVSWKVDALVDTTGQVIVHDFYRDRLVCILCPRRETLAAWMPDGTRYGPSDMIGGPATPGALARLGAALRQASLPVET